jgi:energy-coupling factor transporter ATP-binding protein EcfA2
VRIRTVRLTWFRGAATGDHLETLDKSIAVYGANGSGKSSFVDALEYVLNDGRIRHLAHEYSGKHQEKAIINTHRPATETSEIVIDFADKTSVRVEIARSGTHSVSGDGVHHLNGWDCRRTVLRQDEVSEFVHSTKGQKYSVLLPLLGLGHLETTAENLRQLSAAITKQSGIKEATSGLTNATKQCQSVYGADVPKNGIAGLSQLCEAVVGESHPHNVALCLDRIEKAINDKLDDATEQQRMQLAVEQLASTDLKSVVAVARAAAASLAHVADEGGQRQLEIVRAAAAFLESKSGRELDQCPACGQSVSYAQMRAHLDEELARLEKVIEKSAAYKESVRAVLKTVDRVVSLCKSDEIRLWCITMNDDRLTAMITAATSVVLEGDELNERLLETISKSLGAAVVAAASAAAFLPPPAKELARSKEKLLAVRSLLNAEKDMGNAQKGEALANLIDSMQSDVRQQIHDQTLAVIADISSDIQRMWSILHPGDPIEDVRLHIPNEADKAIDISLKFHGKELESPRLTLSEGYRNSLGLCVFLAMAARDSSTDVPITLDDVIVSLDRGHRGMVVSLLEQEFATRQVLLFTHDRDWYADLRQQLGEKDWTFRALIPYKSPNEGICWSDRTGTFADAKKFLATRPDVAANEARKVMDVELSIHAAKLELRLPYVRGDKNDRRMAHEFLSTLMSEGRSTFKRKDPVTGKYSAFSEAIAGFEAADTLLTTWANRGSHSEDVVSSEAERLIDVCDQAIGFFKCSACGKSVHFAETSKGSYQCQCGLLRWS